MIWPATLHASEAGAYQPLVEQERVHYGGASTVLGELDQPDAARSGTLCVAGRQLEFPLGVLPGWHLSVVLRYTNGNPIEYEGGPTRNVPGAYGRIVVRKRVFRPRPDRQGVVVAYVRRTDLRDWEQPLDGEVDRLNAAAVDYEPLTGPNSNTVVRTLLLRLWLPPLQPAALAPGFNHEAL